MSENILNRYFSFQMKQFLSFGNVILSYSKDEKEKKTVLERYFTTYFNCFYFHQLETTSNDSIIDYDFSLIQKELDGVRVELLYRLEHADILEDADTYAHKQQLIEYCYHVALLAIDLDFLSFPEERVDSQFVNQVKQIISSHSMVQIEDFSIILSRILFWLKEKRKKEKAFLDASHQFSMSLHTSKFSQNPIYYKLNLMYSIPKLQKNYKSNTLSRVFENETISYDKTKIICQLFSFTALQSILTHQEFGLYFLTISDSILSKKKQFSKILSYLDQSYLKEHLIFMIDFDTYLSHRKYLNRFVHSYLFCLSVDFSRVRDVTKKLDAISSLNLFHYVYAHHIKQTDYEIVSKYSFSSGQELLIEQVKE